MEHLVFLLIDIGNEEGPLPSDQHALPFFLHHIPKTVCYQVVKRQPGHNFETIDRLLRTGILNPPSMHGSFEPTQRSERWISHFATGTV